MRREQTPISGSAQIALEVIRPRIDETDGGLPRATAKEVIVMDETTLPDASSILDELLQKGYLYQVDENLRLP